MSVSDNGGSGVRAVSVLPGRIRLRAVEPSARRRLGAVADAVGTWPQVRSVAVRAQSSSVVLHFDADDATAVADGLLGLGVDARAVATRRSPEDPARSIAAAARATNRAVGRRLGGTDLRVLMPVGLGLLAARRAMRGDERLADAPWYILAWYASETFFRFNGGAASAPGQLAESEEE